MLWTPVIRALPTTDGDDVPSFDRVAGPTSLSPGVDQGNILLLTEDRPGLLLDHGFSRLMDQTVEPIKLLDLALQYIPLSLAISFIRNIDFTWQALHRLALFFQPT